MPKFIATLGLLAAAALTPALAQDSLDMGATRQSSFEAPGKPSRGMTEARVRSTFGEPRSRDAAVGEPPISRWHYESFVVYFEHDKVIHAVSRR